MPGKVVLIEWVDSKGGCMMWEYTEDIEPLPPVVCWSAGFLVDDQPDYKTIALSMSDTQVMGRMTIPAGCIKSIKKL